MKHQAVTSVFEHLVGEYYWYDAFSLCLYQNNGVLSLGVDYANVCIIIFQHKQHHQ